jgi:hypothetical protein
LQGFMVPPPGPLLRERTAERRRMSISRGTKQPAPEADMRRASVHILLQQRKKRAGPDVAPGRGADQQDGAPTATSRPQVIVPPASILSNTARLPQTRDNRPETPNSLTQHPYYRPVGPRSQDGFAANAQNFFLGETPDFSRVFARSPVIQCGECSKSARGRAVPGAPRWSGSITGSESDTTIAESPGPKRTRSTGPSSRRWGVGSGCACATRRWTGPRPTPD